ncbi:hypothetical protein EVJ58_g547 [Rhodofomes roseus]|uniref:F-box domain-containing protein n=1 Tax=Rhodofomes roseus TaxID=34475 RepID=A0A4Y9Z2Z3_9APHY|nr:hypothetical protein EVJ58_g547 [Rhodofomes roseus]
MSRRAPAASSSNAMASAHSLAILGEYTHTLDSLPLDLSRNFAEFRELDAVLSASMSSLTSKITQLTTMLETNVGTKEERLWLLADIAEEATHLKLGSEDKIRVACHAADGLRGHKTHMRALLQHIPDRDFESLDALCRKTVYPHVAPYPASAQGSLGDGRRQRRSAHGSLLASARLMRAPRTQSLLSVASHLPPSAQVAGASHPRQSAARAGNGNAAKRARATHNHEHHASTPVDQSHEMYVPPPSASAAHPSLPSLFAHPLNGIGEWRPGQLEGPGMPVAPTFVNTSVVVADENDGVVAPAGEGEGEGDDGKTYCVCNGVSYGEMIACDDASCDTEWFHLLCVGLQTPPVGEWPRWEEEGWRWTLERSEYLDLISTTGYVLDTSAGCTLDRPSTLAGIIISLHITWLLIVLARAVALQRLSDRVRDNHVLFDYRKRRALLTRDAAPNRNTTAVVCLASCCFSLAPIVSGLLLASYAMSLTTREDIVLVVPPEVWLHIFSYLDLPELANLARVSPVLACYAEDPVLHHHRLHVVAPSRVSHSLFGQSSDGLPLRPTVSDLVHRGIMRGLGIERRWRAGMYFYSQHMVAQYEVSLRLQRTHAGNVVESALRRRSSTSLYRIYSARVLPDELPSAAISSTLIPAMRKLKWSIQRDRLAKLVKARSEMVREGGVVAWLEDRGKAVMRRENERVRLALCPGIGGTVRFYENLSHR